ncbi:ATP-binding protein [Streptomyces sp. adm13(2018)]|uniref:ATP-binding protein n=1 Tax=Streptomyces sp. adm13(2018) TaxID=2479007 RepID=UPI003967ADE6
MESHTDGEMEDQPPPDGCLVRAGYALDGGGGCIAAARAHVAVFLDRARTEHRLPVSQRTRDLAQLIVSELVTNAHKYAPGPVLMELRVSAGWVDIVVWDSDPAVPAARAADPGRVGQHGMEIIKAVAAELFIEQEAIGKRITARLALTESPSLAQP